MTYEIVEFHKHGLLKWSCLVRSSTGYYHFKSFSKWALRRRVYVHFVGLDDEH